MSQIKKVIIIAAGMGKRLRPLTNDKPKCLLDVGGKTIMERQLETLKLCGINDTAVIRGYQADKINFANIKYYENTDYQNNNILNSLFCAAPEMDGGFIASYSDILYDKSVIEKLLEDRHDVATVVDTDWQGYYQNRTKHPLEEAEKVIIRDGKVVKLGKKIKADEASGEFIGMIKLSGNGAEIFKKEFARVKKEYDKKPFHESAVFEKSYLTDMLQELIDQGNDVYPVLIQKNWWEIDTPQDLEKVRQIFGNQKIMINL
ncbi:MAG: phosphocholine cytidylyltransferase family protein [Candidatus Nealsonbacteria bacterium]